MIEITTTKPETLLENIKKEIKENDIKTWGCDSDGDFTHTADQWDKAAWLRPQIKNQQPKLTFSIIFPKGKTNSAENEYTSGIYHGRFIQMLLNHFYELIDSIKVNTHS
ncbi:MAG: hypothetical protein ACLTWE_08050 [Dysgonomonas mossii]|uniref:hypothetical protein n=1 Tax=Dysgonomonas mossii TaxID=163665 RepID=UPI0039964884